MLKIGHILWFVVTFLIRAYIQARSALNITITTLIQNILTPKYTQQLSVTENSESSIICFVVVNNLLHVPYQSQLILIKLSLYNQGIYKRGEHLHTYTYDDEFFKRQLPNLSVWERKRKHIDTKRHTLVQTSMLSLLYMPQQSCNDVSSIFIHYAMLWIIYGFINRWLWIIFVIL